jgi:prepilin peptidase CpaA
MAAALQFASAIGFAALMATAAFEDVRRLVIPNRLVLALLLLWPLHLAIMPTVAVSTGLAAAACALGVFLCGALMFSRGWVGGGDVKLLSVATLWAGPGRLASLLLLIGLLGGALSLLSLTPVGGWIGLVRRDGAGPQDTPAMAIGLPVPYGAAIAGAALIVVIPSQWS